jgi:hypothetical protein
MVERAREQQQQQLRTISKKKKSKSKRSSTTSGSQEDPVAMVEQKWQQETKRILHELVSGLQHLHELHIVHRDIKPQNILIDQNNTYVQFVFLWIALIA